MDESLKFVPMLITPGKFSDGQDRMGARMPAAD
jgi:hypothetical protein